MRKSTISVAILAGLLALKAGSGSAMQVAYAAPSLGETDPAGLEEAARNLFANPKRYGEAVKLLLKAAEQRAPADPIRVSNLIMASRLSFYRGDAERAKVLMERAADEALTYGDVATAAQTYLDAAFLAQEVKDRDSAARLAKRAEQLSNSPLLAADQRESIRRRVPAGV